MIKSRIKALDIFLVFSFALAVLFFSQTNTQAPYNVYPKLISGLLAFFALACIIQEQLKDRPQGAVKWASYIKPTVIIISIFVYILAMALSVWIFVRFW